MLHIVLPDWGNVLPDWGNFAACLDGCYAPRCGVVMEEEDFFVFAPAAVFER